MGTFFDLTLSLEWQSESPAGPIGHRDVLFAPAADPAALRVPGRLQAALKEAGPGDRVDEFLKVEELPGYDHATEVIESGSDIFQRRLLNGTEIEPRFGRFYPSGLFRGFGDGGMRPFRYLGKTGGKVPFDPRHPLAGKQLNLSIEVGQENVGGGAKQGSEDWISMLLDGPGLQACWRGMATDFVYGGAYARQDENIDRHFYAEPRMVAHLDSRARTAIGNYYIRFLNENSTVLDLMSSLYSSLGAGQKPGRLIGLGMNATEMQANEMLDGAVVADLNAHPVLPYSDSTFDLAICTASIDYLIEPVEIFREARRILRPGGTFALTFSNRWFPTKVTRLWTELHPFERMGLVASYFAEAGGYSNLETYSLRGLPRPASDPYIEQTPCSDPVFAVAGRRN